MALTVSDERALLELAHEAIRNSVSDVPFSERPVHVPIMDEFRGAFVTVHCKGQLRGCIGYPQAVKDLKTTIVETAQAAVTRDPRFQPIQEDELEELTVEISVLTPIQPVSDIEEIEPGHHGLIVQQGMFRGLLLPQVAEEYHWNRMQFLENTCIKAGLPRDAWQNPETKISIFSAEVFNDKTGKAT